MERRGGYTPEAGQIQQAREAQANLQIEARRFHEQVIFQAGVDGVAATPTQKNSVLG